MRQECLCAHLALLHSFCNRRSHSGKMRADQQHHRQHCRCLHHWRREPCVAGLLRGAHPPASLGQHTAAPCCSSRSASSSSAAAAVVPGQSPEGSQVHRSMLLALASPSRASACSAKECLTAVLFVAAISCAFKNHEGKAAHRAPALPGAAQHAASPDLRSALAAGPQQAARRQPRGTARGRRGARLLPRAV